jgi:hypothetical protein
MTMSPAPFHDEPDTLSNDEGSIRWAGRPGSWPPLGPSLPPLGLADPWDQRRHSWPLHPGHAYDFEQSRDDWLPGYTDLVSSNLTIPSLIFN